MKIHLLTILSCAFIMVASKQGRCQDIVAVHDEQGHTVWVNNEEPKAKIQPSASATPSGAPSSSRVVSQNVGSQSAVSQGVISQNKVTKATKLVYWSRTEGRWKPVLPPTPSIMNAAQQAALEVSSFVASAPKATKPLLSPEPYSPDTDELTRGREISQESVDSAVEAAAARHGVDANLVRAVIKVESNFNPRAVSRKGAMGLMQLMPGTAKSMNVKNAFDPRQNVDAGVRHLKSLLENYNGKLELSLAAYNSGSGAVEKHKGVPPYRETRNYVKKITDLYQGSAPLATSLTSRIRVSHDADGHVVFSNQ